MRSRAAASSARAASSSRSCSRSTRSSEALSSVRAASASSRSRSIRSSAACSSAWRVSASRVRSARSASSSACMPLRAASAASLPTVSRSERRRSRSARARAARASASSRAAVSFASAAAAASAFSCSSRSRRSCDRGARGRAVVLAGGVAVVAGALQALQAGEQLDPLRLGGGIGGGGAAGGGVQALQLGLGELGLALGGLGLGAARLRLALGLLDLAGEPAGDALELVDALHRREQAGDDRGGVVEVVDRPALDAGIRVGDGLLALGVLAGALLLAADELVRDPRGRRERAEGDHGAGGAPAVPGLGLLVEGGAQRADHDGVLLAHAQQHQVHRELEGEVLEEEREVEALVELDGDEDGLERELRLRRRVAGGDLDERAGVRRVAGGEEAAPLLGVVGQRAGEQALEEPVPQRVGRLLAEQQLGGLGPLRHGALAVGEDEPAADDLLEQRVQRIAAHGLLRRDGRGRRSGGQRRVVGAGRRSGGREIHAGTGRERERLLH